MRRPRKALLLHAHPPCPGSDPIDEVRRGGFETRPYTSAEQPAYGARPAPGCEAAIRCMGLCSSCLLLLAQYRPGDAEAVDADGDAAIDRNLGEHRADLVGSEPIP